MHALEHLVWETLPSSLGFQELPPWWSILTLVVAGVIVALAVTYLPGQGGHVPVAGLGGGTTPPNAVPGTVLAAAASLVGGAVVGPEAPLIAIGGGLALWAASRTTMSTDATMAVILSAAGAAAAISAIFGNPLVAAVIFLEILGVTRRQTMLVVVPCLLASGVGALIFTGLGRWTGLEIGALAIPDLEPRRLGLGDVAWAVPLAGITAALTWAVFLLGHQTARLAAERVVVTTVGAGLVAGTAACAYAVLTGRSAAEVAMSGQATLPALATDPAAWSTGALIALLFCKGVAYGVCLGTFRGGAVFPAVLLGAAVAALADAWVPHLEDLPALAIGIAAGVAVTGLPVTSVVLVVLLLGDAAVSQMPVVIIAVVTATVVHELLARLAKQPRPAVDQH